MGFAEQMPALRYVNLLIDNAKAIQKRRSNFLTHKY